MTPTHRVHHREYMRAYRQPGWAEKRAKERELRRQLRADPVWAEEQRELYCMRKKARMLAAEGTRCYNPTCLRRAVTEVIRGFVEDGEIVMREVPYCGGC